MVALVLFDLVRVLLGFTMRQYIIGHIVWNLENVM